MNSKQLFYFVSVAETGSFTAAAQKLGLSPAAFKQTDHAAGGRAGRYTLKTWLRERQN